MFKLPKPPEQLQIASNKLSEKIISEIKKQGSINFAKFMQLALYDRDYGYYSLANSILGEDGDFITSPEISELFAYCLAENIFYYSNITINNILEIGAGTGKLASDIISFVKQNNLNLENYYILEVSANLKSKQQEILQKTHPDYFHKIIWMDTLPNNFIGAIIANELLDAMPCSLINCHNGIFSRHVIYENNKFNWLDMPLDEQEKKALAEITEYNLQNYENYKTELPIMHSPWLASIYDSMQIGKVLLIDYGYLQKEFYHPKRSEGTLRCHYRQLAHEDPFFYPGLQDITYHVDFSRVINSAKELGFTIISYETQAQFLLANGLLDYAKQNLSALEQKLQSQDILKLTDPGQMGEIFKVLVLDK